MSAENHYIIIFYKSFITQTFPLTSDFLEASFWASTVEVTLHTSGTPLIIIFSFSIVATVEIRSNMVSKVFSTQFSTQSIPSIVLCFNVLFATGLYGRYSRVAFVDDGSDLPSLGGRVRVCAFERCCSSRLADDRATLSFALSEPPLGHVSQSKAPRSSTHSTGWVMWVSTTVAVVYVKLISKLHQRSPQLT